MKVGLVSTFDTLGGAARAAVRLHNGLIEKHIDSSILVQDKNTNNPKIFGPKTKAEKFWTAISPRLDALPLKFYPNRESYIFTPGYFGSLDINNYHNNYDIFNIHWVAGFQSIGSIASIKKPIVLTMHDSWAFTGGCHIPFPCEKFMTKCGECIKLSSNKDVDLSTRVWQRKYDMLKGKNIVLVGDGTWVAENAKKSAIFNNHRVEVIHPGLDLSVYKPLNKRFCRDILGVEDDVKLILFGAVIATSDKNKGFHLLVQALKKLSEENVAKQKIKLIVFGASSPTNEYLGFDTQYIGKVNDDISLAVLYSAADVMIVPSIIESFGQTASESFACGTPVVAFRTSGLKDIVDHKINGFLADPYDYKDLAAGISWVLEDNERLVKLGIEARGKAVKKFGMAKYVDSYISVFESMLI